jgi:hypothetical protein
VREIDEIRIEGNVLTIYDTRGERHRFKMGVPEQVYEEVVAKLLPLASAAQDERLISHWKERSA